MLFLCSCGCLFINVVIDVVKDLEAKDPHLFELNKSNIRVFSITETIFSLGGMLGPLLTGSLFETIGFFYMSVVLGKSYNDSVECVLPLTNIVIFTAAICLTQAVVSWRWLDRKASGRGDEHSP